MANVIAFTGSAANQLKFLLVRHAGGWALPQISDGDGAESLVREVYVHGPRSVPLSGLGASAAVFVRCETDQAFVNPASELRDARFASLEEALYLLSEGDAMLVRQAARCAAQLVPAAAAG
jgi:hypothetical protein